MKSVLKIVLLCSVLVSFNYAARAQDDDRLMAAEKEEVIKLAKKFSERYEKTKTLEPLIGEFFRPDFSQYIRKGPYATDNSFYQMMDLSVVNVDDAVLRRFYVAFVDLGHLGPTWVWQTGVDVSDDNFLPADVRNVVKRDKFLAPVFLDSDEASNDALPFSSREEFEQATLNLEKIRRLYQRHLRGFPANKSNHFTKRYAQFEEETDRYFDPHGRACEHSCFGLDIGSIIYQVTVPPYHFMFVGKIDGKMKVLEILPFSN